MWRRAVVKKYQSRNETYVMNKYTSFNDVRITKNLLIFAQATGLGVDGDRKLIGNTLYLTPIGLDGIVKIDWNIIQKINPYKLTEVEVSLKRPYRKMIVFASKKLRLLFSTEEDMYKFITESGQRLQITQ